MEILVEVLTAIGRFFINPLVYIAIVALVLLGYGRVKRERQFFKTRILSGWTELGVGLRSVVASLIASVVVLAAGLVVPTQFFIVYIVVAIVMLATTVFHFLSPIWLFFVTAVVLILMGHFDVSFHLFGLGTVNGLAFDSQMLVSVVLLAGVLLILESRFIKGSGVQLSSPVLEKTKRGLTVVAYKSKGLRMYPLFLLVPGDVVQKVSDYWPVFAFGELSFSIVLFPFVAGFQLVTRKTLPEYYFAKESRGVNLLGQIVIILGLVGYFYPVASIVTLAVAAVVRFIITWVTSAEEKQDLYAVTPQKRGVMVAGVLPNSPAEKMGLRVGEIIVRVNGQEVGSEKELYEALQINAAYCKLEVLDHQKEIRLTQHVVHSEDNHKIGVLMIQ